MADQEIGRVTHYFNHVGVAIVEISEGTLSVGDTIHIVGHTSDLTQKVESIQIEHENVDSIKAGQSAGVRVSDHVREHDRVYKVE